MNWHALAQDWHGIGSWLEMCPFGKSWMLSALALWQLICRSADWWIGCALVKGHWIYDEVAGWSNIGKLVKDWYWILRAALGWPFGRYLTIYRQIDDGLTVGGHWNNRIVVDGWMDWPQSGMGLSSRICIRLAYYPRIGIGLADLWRIGILVHDWHMTGGLALDWQMMDLQIGLEDWQNIVIFPRSKAKGK